MHQFDQEKMARLVSHLRKSVARLRDLRNITQDRFVDDPDKVASAKYHFIAAIDMCNHLISRNGFRAPEDYADTFQVMVEQGALEREFSEELKRMAKFRNRLVHLYWEVDDEQVYQILQSRLSDFKIFLDSLARFLAWPENSAS
jgi:uncharacterized protein YutE (UPF0331/DUF86 family)